MTTEKEHKAAPTPRTNIVSASMPAGSAFTGSIGISGTPVMITMPPAWDKANLTIQISPDGGATWFGIYHPDGSEFQCKVIPGAAAIFDRTLNWVSMLRLCSGSSASPVPQSATRNFQIILD